MTDLVARLARKWCAYCKGEGYLQPNKPHYHGAVAAAIREALEIERKRAVAYLDVLAANHPHLQEAYHHAKLNLEAVLQTDWQPGEALREGR